MSADKRLCPRARGQRLPARRSRPVRVIELGGHGTDVWPRRGNLAPARRAPRSGTEVLAQALTVEQVRHHATRPPKRRPELHTRVHGLDEWGLADQASVLHVHGRHRLRGEYGLASSRGRRSETGPRHDIGSDLSDHRVLPAVGVELQPTTNALSSRPDDVADVGAGGHPVNDRVRRVTGGVQRRVDRATRVASNPASQVVLSHPLRVAVTPPEGTIGTRLVRQRCTRRRRDPPPSEHTHPPGHALA